MAEQILDKARDIVEGTIDFEGQKRVDSLITGLLILTGFVAFNAGYVTQDIRLCLYIMLSGSLATFVAAVPSWPFYNKKPVKWLPAGSALRARGA